VNLDLTIHRIVAQETESLLMRQVLFARKRAELDLELAKTSVKESSDSAGASLERALQDLEDESAALVRDTTRRVDKQA
jgi:hypothetical protein